MPRRRAFPARSSAARPAPPRPGAATPTPGSTPTPAPPPITSAMPSPSWSRKPATAAASPPPLPAKFCKSRYNGRELSVISNQLLLQELITDRTYPVGLGSCHSLNAAKDGSFLIHRVTLVAKRLI